MWPHTGGIQLRMMFDEIPEKTPVSVCPEQHASENEGIDGGRQLFDKKRLRMRSHGAPWFVSMSRLVL
jgi:hypothetical protein